MDDETTMSSILQWLIQFVRQGSEQWNKEMVLPEGELNIKKARILSKGW